MKLQSVKLLTSKLEMQRMFYTQIMELPLLKENSDMFTIIIGTSHLTFERSTIANENPFYHFAFDIPGNKVDEAIAWLNSRGISLNLLPHDKYQIYSKTWNATSIYFYDHAGNIVEFIARHNLNHSSTAEFSAESLLNISEIGLVVNDVSSTKELLGSRFSINGYKDYNNSFAAVGDEQGLFILSVNKRVWLGSSKQANIYKTEVVIEGDLNKGELTLKGYPYKIIAY